MGVRRPEAATVPETMAVYQLSEAGRSMPWAWYKDLNWGLTHWGEWEVSRILGLPIARWPEGLTLGEIEDASPAAGRDIARVLVEKLSRPELSAPYVCYNVEKLSRPELSAPYVCYN